MKIEKIENIRWTDDSKTLVSATVTYKGLLPVNVVARENDRVGTLKEVFRLVKSGEYGDIGDPVPSNPVGGERYSKKKFFEEMTDAEYDNFAKLEAKQSPRKVRLFKEAQELNSTDPAFPELRALLVSQFGEPRTAVILSKSKI